MSSKEATYYYEKYKDKYACVLHCNNSNDNNKNELKNINEYWAKFRIVIYTPTVKSGVNCDIDHFDNIYVILSPKSTSQRGCLKMASRVRNIKNNNILVYLNNMPYNEHENFIKYELSKEYVKNICKSNNKWIIDEETHKPVIINTFDENDLCTKMLIHNENEKANKNVDIFVLYFIKMLTNKGHTHEYNSYCNTFINTTKKEKNEHNKNAKIMKNNIPINEVLEALDINKTQYDDYCVRVFNNEATKDEKIAISKYNFKQFWNIDVVTEELLNKFYGKDNMLTNLRYLLDDSLIKMYSVYGNIIYDEKEKYEQVTMIKEIIKMMGFDLLNIGVKHDRDTFSEKMKVVMTESKFFVDEVKSQLLFGYNKYKIGKIESIKSFMGFIGTLLSD